MFSTRRMRELPAAVGGLRVAPPPRRIRRPAPPKPKPHVEVRHKVIAPVHPHKARPVPEIAPSLSGTRKAPARVEHYGIRDSATGPSAESGGASQGKEKARRVGAGQRQPRRGQSIRPGADDSGRLCATWPFQAVAVAHFESPTTAM